MRSKQILALSLFFSLEEGSELREGGEGDDTGCLVTLLAN
jgi:hypothetical protein